MLSDPLLLGQARREGGFFGERTEQISFFFCSFLPLLFPPFLSLTWARRGQGKRRCETELCLCLWNAVSDTEYGAGDSNE